MSIDQWREICRDAARLGLTSTEAWREACRLRGRGGSEVEVRDYLGL